VDPPAPSPEPVAATRPPVEPTPTDPFVGPTPATATAVDADLVSAALASGELVHAPFRGPFGSEPDAILALATVDQLNLRAWVLRPRRPALGPLVLQTGMLEEVGAVLFVDADGAPALEAVVDLDGEVLQRLDDAEARIGALTTAAADRHTLAPPAPPEVDE
jgi:hypothetical protein